MREKNIQYITDLEDMASLPRDSVRRLLSGRTRNPHAERIEPIARALGMTVSELLGAPAPKEKLANLPDNFSGKDTGWFIAPDDAMAPTIPAGEPVLIDWSLHTVNAAGVYAITLEDGTVTLRRLAKLVTGGKVKVSVDNPAYPAEGDVAPIKLKISGKVLGLLKRL